MRVIDLINKQYCNEEMPRNIKINKLNYTYDNNRKTYKNEYGEFMSFDFTNNVLNMQVETIEDTIDIDSIEKLYIGEVITEDRLLINELVQAVKQLNKEIKELKSLNIEISEEDINKAIEKAREQMREE